MSTCDHTSESMNDWKMRDTGETTAKQKERARITAASRSCASWTNKAVGPKYEPLEINRPERSALSKPRTLQPKFLFSVNPKTLNPK